MTSAIRIISGIACLCLCGLIAYLLRPRQDMPPSLWTRTEVRATAFALGLLTLFITGGGLVARGLFP